MSLAQDLAAELQISKRVVYQRFNARALAAMNPLARKVLLAKPPAFGSFKRNSLAVIRPEGYNGPRSHLLAVMQAAILERMTGERHNARRTERGWEVKRFSPDLCFAADDPAREAPERVERLLSLAAKKRCA
jgi:hypothetical protein